MKNFTLLAILGCAAVLSSVEAATVRGKVSIAPRRGPAPTLSETLVSLQPATTVKPRKPENVQMSTRAKTLVPHILAIPVGSSVQFPNDDPILHNLFSLSTPNNFDLGLYRRNSGKSQTFNASGIVNIYCNVHPSMSAVLHIMSTPYYVFADAAGDYSIPDVPAGKYTLTAWNEVGGATQSQVEITATGEVKGTTNVLLDGKTLRPGQHLNKYGQPYSRSTNDY